MKTAQGTKSKGIQNFVAWMREVASDLVSHHMMVKDALHGLAGVGPAMSQ